MAAKIDRCGLVKAAVSTVEIERRQGATVRSGIEPTQAGKMRIPPTTENVRRLSTNIVKCVYTHEVKAHAAVCGSDDHVPRLNSFTVHQYGWRRPIKRWIVGLHIMPNISEAWGTAAGREMGDEPTTEVRIP